MMEDEQYDLPKVIPAYYCCYLLRSLGTGCKGSALYIGSTPDPARRLAQHNGLSKGGARKTANDKRRPWEMVMVVEGFTSNIAALQFEWAWQHPAATRHLTLKDSDDNGKSKAHCDFENDAVVGDSQQKPKAQKKSKAEKGSKAPEKGTEDDKKKRSKRKPPSRRTRTSLKAHLEDLHLLLRSTYFKDWPLTLRFFAADVSQAWRGWCDRVDGIIPDHIKVIADGNCTDIFTHHAERKSGVGSVQGIKVDYTPIKDYLEKGMFLLDDIKNSNCRMREKKRKALKNIEGEAVTVEKTKAAATIECYSDEDGHDTDSLDDYWDRVLDSDLESATNSYPQEDSKVSEVEAIIEDSELDDDEPLG